MNVKQVRALLKTGGVHPIGECLYVQTTGDGTGSWMGRISINGKRREMGLGSVDLDGKHGGVTLAEARDGVSAAKRKARQGLDPIREREDQRAAQDLEDGARISFRITPALKAAALKAAAADVRSVPSLVEKLLVEHCRAHGFLTDKTRGRK
jgi:hypothetical protein